MENEQKTEKVGFVQRIGDWFTRFFTRENLKVFAKDHIYDLCALTGLLICILVFTIVPPLQGKPSIWRPISVQVILNNASVFFILAIGAVFIYLMGCMDISVGYQVGVFAYIFIIISNAMHGDIILSFLVIVVLGLVCALFNAFVGAYVKLPTVMSSVILMQLFIGTLAFVYEDNGINSIALEADLSLLRSTPFRIITIIVLAFVAFYFLTFTKIGKRSRAIGANKLAADQAGARLLLTRILCYSFFSVFLCLAAIMCIGVSNGISSSTTNNYQMEIMIMLLMGGMPLSGGMKGKLFNAIVGAFTYAILDRGLRACGADEYVMLIKSIIFLVIVCLTCRKPGALLPR